MDLTTRKNKFIQQFMEVVGPEKIERFEELLRAETTSNNEVVAYRINGVRSLRHSTLKITKKR
ncbi:MAG: hypothetical protein ACPG7E_02445 [Marinirhabdus sp.]